MSRLLPLVRVAALISLLASAAGRQRRVPLPTIRRAFYSLVLVVSLLAPPAAAQTSPSSGVGSVPTVLATVRIGTAPTGVAVNPKTNRVYVSDTIANKLSVADGTTNVVLASTLVGKAPIGVAVNATTNRIYVANGAAGTVSVLDGGVRLKIVSPTSGAAANVGTVKVSVDYSGPALVPAAEAKKLEEYHLHYFLDEDAGPYIGTTTPVPSGNPHIMHSAAREVTFDSLPAGEHTLTVLMSGNNHISVNPPVTDSVTFQVK